MIFRSRLFLHENHFFVKICTSAGFLDQPLSKFQTLLRHYICPLVMGFNRRWEETLPNLAKFLQPSESKNAHFSFGRGDDLLGHLDRRPPLGEALETLESVVYENPVLVRLASVVI